MDLEEHLDLGYSELSHHNFLTETSDKWDLFFFFPSPMHINHVICHRFTERDVEAGFYEAVFVHLSQHACNLGTCQQVRGGAPCHGFIRHLARSSQPCGWLRAGTAHCLVGLVPLIVKIAPWYAATPLPRCLAKRNENICLHKNLVTAFISTLFIVAKKGKQSKCPSTDRWVNKVCESMQ